MTGHGKEHPILLLYSLKESYVLWLLLRGLVVVAQLPSVSSLRANRSVTASIPTALLVPFAAKTL